MPMPAPVPAPMPHTRPGHDTTFEVVHYPLSGVTPLSNKPKCGPIR